MRLYENCYQGYNNVDLVIDTLPRRDFKYASEDEKRDPKYSEQFFLSFDRRTHDIVKGGVDFIYEDEYFDGVSLDDMKRDGFEEFVNRKISECREYLNTQLGLGVEEENERE